MVMKLFMGLQAVSGSSLNLLPGFYQLLGVGEKRTTPKTIKSKE
jgi:hypothetical protein